MLPFPRVLNIVICPVPVCPEVANRVGRMREHFMYRNFFAQIAVMQEGREPLPCYKLCGIQMPEGRLLKHQQMKRCTRNTQMRWVRKNIAIASRCKRDMFSLTGEEDVDCIEGGDTFKYLWIILDPSDDKCPAVLWNVGKSRRVWNRLGKLLQR